MWLCHEHDSQLGLEQDVPPQGSQQALMVRELAPALESLHQHRRSIKASSHSLLESRQPATHHGQANKMALRARGSSTGTHWSVLQGVKAQGMLEGGGLGAGPMQRWEGRLLPAGGSLQWGPDLG